MSLTVPTEMDTLRAPTPVEQSSRSATPTKYLTHLPNRPPVDIEFCDLCYTVPMAKGSKLILRNVSGLFKSGQLTAILGPSGAGKSTLLNILAGYKTVGATGSVLTNGEARNMELFHKLSRYIMQEDLLQPNLTVHELMMISSNLKLGNSQSKEDKLFAISEILEMLRLTGARNTETSRLSGGEKKRLSIAQELVNNPPVIFLDEPTTGLDDLSSSQCISLLKALAEGGRTIICSIHTPSAKLFAMFDHVYIVSQGCCVFQGNGSDIVPFLQNLGLTCPTHYNPADFVVEVSSGEYGSYTERMTSAIDNGKIYRWHRPATKENAFQPATRTTPLQSNKDDYAFSSSGWSQFTILLSRMMIQQWRDSMYLLIKFLLHVLVALVVGGMFWRMGNDGSKTLFNFGLCFICCIAFMYIPLLPVLLQFPTEVQLLKREYFNRWYGLTSYFFALSISRLPAQIFFGTIFVGIVYVMTDQPMELYRGAWFLVLCLFVSVISESFGLVLSSCLSVVNGVFAGPASCVPLMLLAVYGLGSSTGAAPIYIQICMKFSYLRYALEGLIYAIYGWDRPKMECPVEETYCHYRSPKSIIILAGMEDVSLWVNLAALIVFLIIFRSVSFFLLRYRLSSNYRFIALHRITRIIKANFDKFS